MVVCYRHTQLAYLETAELNNNDNNNNNNNVMDPKTAGGKSSPPVDVTSFISDNLLPLSLDSWVGDAQSSAAVSKHEWDVIEQSNINDHKSN